LLSRAMCKCFVEGEAWVVRRRTQRCQRFEVKVEKSGKI
jgi:hypothetical protein